MTRLEAMAEDKLLTFNHLISSLVVLGSKKERKKVEEKWENNPLLLKGLPMKIKSQEKYLGEQIIGSLEESILATIRKWGGIVMLAINDIANVIKDVRLSVVGGIVAALEIWEDLHIFKIFQRN